MKILLLKIATLIVGMVISVTAMADVKQVDLIIEGDYIVPMTGSDTVIEKGAVAIKDSKIIFIGAAADVAARYSADTVVDGKGKLVMPGLINGHTHSSMTLFRGIADDLDLMTWLQDYIFPMEGQFVDPEFIKLGTELACYEMIESGTTTFVDMYFYPDVIAGVVDKCGLRAMVAAPMIDFPSPGFKGWDDSFAGGISYIKRWKGKNDRITPVLAPHASYTVSPEHLKIVVQASKDLDVPVTMHLAEDGSEQKAVSERYGKTPVSHADSLGMFDVPFIGAHVVLPSEDEIKILATKSAGAIHNPTSNMKLGAGISPVPAMLKAGVNVGLGTDGAASNNDLNMWDEIRLASLIHKSVTHDPKAMPAYTSLSLATSSGAKAIGLGNQIGTLEAGKYADMIQVSLDSPRLAPMYNVISHLVYAVTASDVVTTVVAGKILMKDRKVLTLDGEDIRQRANAMADKIKAALKK